MELTCLHVKKVFFNLLCGILLFSLISSSESATVPAFANETERLTLLDFKNRIKQDPLKIMGSWNDSIHFCNWVGVTCNSSNGRVMILNLEGQRLVGSIPQSVGNLTFLTRINLRNNSFHGEIPQELGRLQKLEHLNLTYNSFSGKIPTNLTHCSELTVLDLVYNNLVGQIPNELSSLLKLELFGLGGNNFVGRIPPWIGNFSSLLKITIARNNFQGSVPYELGRLSRLGYVQLSVNNLSGTIPSAIYNMSSMYYFSVAQNKLHGQLQPDVGLKFPKLETFAGGLNNFTGLIPESLSNASRLEVLDFADNGITGSIPENLRTLQSLVRLNFARNRLGNEKSGDLHFLGSLGNCTSLEVLGLDGNYFGGELPSSIANLTTKLKTLTVGENLIHGSVPIGIGNLVHLTLLGLEGNYFSGHVPDVIGNLQNLEGLNLNVNNFSGQIPSSFGNMTLLTRLFMEENEFEGSIPPQLGSCPNLQVLNLSKNNLNGTIPKEVIGLSSLSISLAMSHNSLTGLLPSEVGKLTNLVELDVSYNKLLGEIPSTLGSCTSLQSLDLEGNTFEGTIPQSLENLRGLEELDLSHNNLSGPIPEFLSKFMFLARLDLSYNQLEGEVSTEGIFRNVSAFLLAGNDKLCGGVPELLLPACTKQSQGRFRNVKELVPSISALILIIMFSCFVAFWLLKEPRRQFAAPSSGEWRLGISYSEVVKSTNGFCEENLIGSGSFGSVYKGIISTDGTKVAIKVINLDRRGALKSFTDECNALKSIRHRNLLSVITVCSSVDHQGNGFKCLVFEFMCNGSLDQWLHQQAVEQSQIHKLSFIQRLSIAIDVASALDYLHHQCETPIVHCDLKPSNVLLHEDMTAHVGDFGLAKFLFEADNTSMENKTITSGLKGSVGYIPPEYGMGSQVSILGDVYSYGILLLEMFTGKRPTDDIFKEDQSIYRFVETAFPDRILEVIDPSMFFEEENEDNDDNENGDGTEEQAMMVKEAAPQIDGRRVIEECLVDARRLIEEPLVGVMKVGLICSATLPSQRMPMNLVVNKLYEIKDLYLQNENSIRRRIR